MSGKGLCSPILIAAAGAALAIAVAAAPLLATPHESGQQRVIVVTEAGKDDRAGRGYLGVSVQDLGRRLREAMDIPGDVDGILVSHVSDDSPAGEAGLRDRDVITRFNGKNVDGVDEFTSVVRAMKPGDRVTVTVWRDGRVRDLEATLGKTPRAQGTRVFRGDGDRFFVAPEPPDSPEPPDAPGAPRPPRAPGDQDDSDAPRAFEWRELPDLDALRGLDGKVMRLMQPHGWLGIEMQPMNDQIAGFFGAPDGDGVLVWKVEPNSPAAEAGLKAGDVIVEVEGEGVSGPGELSEAIAGHDAGDEVAITFLRRGSRDTVKVELKESRSPNMLLFGDMPGRKDAPRFDGRRAERPMERLHREMDRLREQLDRLARRLDEMKD